MDKDAAMISINVNYIYLVKRNKKIVIKSNSFGMIY